MGFGTDADFVFPSSSGLPLVLALTLINPTIDTFLYQPTKVRIKT
jgi:hypothetical protein